MLVAINFVFELIWSLQSGGPNYIRLYHLNLLIMPIKDKGNKKIMYVSKNVDEHQNDQLIMI